MGLLNGRNDPRMSEIQLWQVASTEQVHASWGAECVELRCDKNEQVVHPGSLTYIAPENKPS